MDSFPWDKSLFETLISSLREGLSKRTTHYRLRGLLIAFQVWIYETIPTLHGYVATRTSRTYPRIMNWTVDDHPPTAKLDGHDCFCNPEMEIRDLDPSNMEMAMPYMYEVQYIKPVQLERTRGKKRKGGMVDRSSHSVKATRKPSYSSEKTFTSLFMITDGRLGHSDVPLDDGDDDFVDTPPRWQGTTFNANSPNMEDQPAPNDVIPPFAVFMSCRVHTSHVLETCHITGIWTIDVFTIVLPLVMDSHVVQEVDEMRK
ncbi:Hypothetical predicted protein [Olea europaea subsp. europaea]|uniref:Uncharacterized protein n=1 Tax=Olea europaea subsp. europaea TaxID=158383 RepID=A0A8S0PJ52_OLEEU|nr:Hypothetical predicted protein [Olea europaea subsp. europaea]